MEISETNEYLELCYSRKILNMDNNLLFECLSECKYSKQQINQFIKARETNIYLALHNFFNIETIRTIRSLAERACTNESLKNMLNNRFPIIRIEKDIICYVSYCVEVYYGQLLIYSYIKRISSITEEYNDFKISINEMENYPYVKKKFFRKHKYNNAFKKLFPIKDINMIKELSEDDKFELLKILTSEKLCCAAPSPSMAEVLIEDIMTNRVPTWRHLEELNRLLIKHMYK